MMIRVRPSKLKQISGCNGSAALEEWLLERELIHDDDEDVARLGTIMHDCTAHLVRCLRFEGWDYNPDYNKFREEWMKEYSELSGWDTWLVFGSYLWLRDLIEQEGVDLKDILVEHRMDGADLGMSEGGTADIVLIIPFKKAIVVDWKYGFIEQDTAEINDQLAGYGVMASRTFDIDSVDVYVFQPRHEEAESSAHYDAKLLKEAEAWVRMVCDLAQQEDASLNYNYSSCFYCGALGRCPEAKGKIVDILDAYELIGAESNDALYDIYKAAKLAARAESNLKNEVKLILGNDPAAIKGLSLAPGRKVNEVKDMQALQESMTDAGMNFWDCATVKLGELKKVLPKKSPLLNYIVETGQQAPSIKVSRA